MECTYDRLEIFDGADTAARQLARLCGSGLPNPVVSTGNRLYMTFYTDASVQRKGFEITHTTGTRRYDVVSGVLLKMEVGIRKWARRRV